MRKLLKYDYRRDIESILLFIILATALITAIEVTNILGTPDTDVLGIKGMFLILAFVVSLLYKIKHLSEDTMINKEHGMLIPKTPLQIVLSNSIVAFTYSLISVLYLLIVTRTHGAETIDFSVFLELKIYLSVFIAACIIFFFYIYITWFYIFTLKHVKKVSAAQNIVVIVIFICLVLFSVCVYFTGNFLIIKLLVKSGKLSAILIFLLNILGVLGISATVGHKFSKEKVETKVLYGVSVLSVIVVGFIFLI